MMEFGVSRPLHKTKKRVKQQEISRARKPSKTYRKQCFFNGCYKKNIVKHNIFIAFGSQIPLQIMKNLIKTMVFQLLLSKTIVKHNVFATFGLQNRLQNLFKSFPKTL